MEKYRNRPPPRLLSANWQPGCLLPIHLSSLPWLVVALSFATPHPPPPVVFKTRHLILASYSCHSSSTYHCFKVPQAFKMPPPQVCRFLRLIVTTPLVALLPLLVLSTIHRLLSANAPPPLAGFLFASWLSCHPCCCATAASCPFSTSSRRRRLKCPSLTPTFTNASPPVGLLFASWLSCHPCCRAAAASRPFSISSRHCLKCPSSTPAFIHTGWLFCLILPRCFRLRSSHQHRHLLMRWLLTSHPIWPQPLACVFDLVCPISRFIAICQGYAPTYLCTTGGGGGVYIRYVHMQKNAK